MALMKQSPLEASLLTDFFNDDWFMNASRLGRRTLPAVNIREQDKSYELELAVPGFSKNDFSISIENNMLVISAERRDEKEQKENNYTRREFGYESFSRAFNLPAGTAEEDINASYQDGVLRVSVAKKDRNSGKVKKPIQIK